MAGLTPEELDSIIASRPKGKAAPGNLGVERADAIRREIYQRHGIPEHRTPQEAIDRIEMQAKLRQSLGNDGGAMSGWANHEDKAAARAEYAKQGKTPAEVQARWDESIHLLDQRSQQYMQRFGRDIDFLKNEPQSREAAVRYYDGSAGSQVARKGVYGDVFAPTSGGYQRFGGWYNAAMNALANPETGTGGYFNWSEIPANAILTSMGGETKEADAHRSDAALPAHMRWAASLSRAFMDKEAWDRSRAAHAATVNYRPDSPSSVADFPAGSRPSGAEVADRIRVLLDATGKIQAPMVDERYYRTGGYAPPSVLTQAGDSAVRAIDPSAAIPAIGGAKALMATGRAAVKPLLVELGKDQMREQAFNAGVTGLLGGDPGRSSRQFWLGGGKPGVDFRYKSPEELEDARQTAKTMHEMSGPASERVSRANAEGQIGLGESGALGPVAQMRAAAARKLQSQ